MISPKQLQLLEVWRSNLFTELSIAEIMKISGKKTKPWVFNTLKQLVQQRLLISTRKGNLDLYGLNLNNPLLLQALQYLEVQKNLLFPLLSIVEEALSAIPIRTYCLLIFGSYAERKQKNDSDLDLCFLVENKIVEKKIKPYVNDLKLHFPTKIDEYYISFGDFEKMLLRKEENLAKQIVRKHILFYNPDLYYQLVKEAYRHGFRP